MRQTSCVSRLRSPTHARAHTLRRRQTPTVRSRRQSLCYDWGTRQGGALNAGEDVSKSWFTATWKRPREFLPPGQVPQLFDASISPDDVGQGELGDCYLLSALSVLAERPECIRALFVTERNRPDLGLFVVRLCVQGHWRDVRRARSSHFKFNPPPATAACSLHPLLGR